MERLVGMRFFAKGLARITARHKFKARNDALDGQGLFVHPTVIPGASPGMTVGCER
jgi:hypothetical protein